MNVNAWALILVLTLAAYTSGLTLYWASQRLWTSKKARFCSTAAASLALHVALYVLTGGQALIHLLVVLPGLAVIASAWLKRR